MSEARRYAPNVSSRDLDADLRRLSAILYGIGILIGFAVDLVAPWPSVSRLLLLLSLPFVAVCWSVVRRIPWHRITLPVYLAIHVATLMLIGVAIAASGGWLSPFAVTVALAVAFAAVTGTRGRAVPIALLAGFVTLSPVLYTRGGYALAVGLAAVPAYLGLVYLIHTIMNHVRERERAVAAATQAQQQVEQRAKGLVTLQRVSAIVGAHLSMDEAISAMVDELKLAFGHQLVSVYLRDGENLVLQVQTGYETPYVSIPLGVGICGRVGATGQTAFVPDVRFDPSYRSAVDGVVSELCVPLHDEDRVVGILNMESVGEQLAELDRELLDLFAAQVSVVLRNARLAGELRVQAECDPLTGLLNHRALMEALDGALSSPAARCAVLMVDVDNFKLFNDSYGHLAGDAILHVVAMSLRESCRHDDLAGRYGGDEFLLVLPDTDRATAGAVTARIAQLVREHPHVTDDGTVIPLVISVGVAVAPDDGVTRQELLAVADAAMYAAKQARHIPSLALLDHAMGDLLHTTSLNVLEGLVATVDAKDHYTCEHSADVTRLALLLARRVGLGAREQRALAVAGPLHDVGKIGVPDKILRKPSRLSADEMATIRRHVEIGLAIVRGVCDDAAVLDAIAQHHERWDGNGYPYGLRGEESSLLGRIMQLADATSAMSLDRPYRAGLPPADVAAVLRANAGRQFDPALVEPFVDAYLSATAAHVA